MRAWTPANRISEDRAGSRTAARSGSAPASVPPGAGRRAAACLALALAAVLLASCWDKTELNELAIVTMVGLDEDPDTDRKTIYYQVVNPLTAVTSRGTAGGDQAPVYTYEVSGRSYGEIRASLYRILPRKLFIAYYRAVVVSERMARRDLRDMVNLIQIQPQGRGSVPVLVAREPMDKVMYTLTPLEMYPGESVSLRLSLLKDESLLVGKRIAVRDLVERMERSESVVLPMLETVGEAPSPEFSRMTGTVDVRNSNMQISGGAVIRDYRMTGTLDNHLLIAYNLLKGNKGWFIRQFHVDGKPITLTGRLGRIERSLGDAPRILINIDLALQFAIEQMPRTEKEVHKLEREVAAQLEEEMREVCRQGRKLGLTLPNIRNLEDVRVKVTARLEHISGINQTF